jgi:hypothetical protein
VNEPYPIAPDDAEWLVGYASGVGQQFVTSAERDSLLVYRRTVLAGVYSDDIPPGEGLSTRE